VDAETETKQKQFVSVLFLFYFRCVPSLTSICPESCIVGSTARPAAGIAL
jgi:hypothetical protein